MGVSRTSFNALAAGLLFYAMGACVGPGSSWSAGLDPFAGYVGGLERREGLYTTWQNPRSGQVYLELSQPTEAMLKNSPGRPAGWLGSCLYVEGLTTGLGSNDVGLDRGQLGDTHVLEFREVAGRVFFELPNLSYRATSGDPVEERATQQSFASSVLWSTDILARGKQGQCLIDLTEFLVRDAHQSASKLDADGGSWSLAEDRSALLAESSLHFPDNLEFEALLTFSGKGAGREVREVSPLSSAVTLVQHHSLIRLPAQGYEPLPWDPRAGGFSHSFTDSSAAPNEPNVVQCAVRHRLRKQRPNAAMSEPFEPIVYYIDPAAPPAIREALMEGASWWNQAFTAAGYTNAFLVEYLPQDAHPLDVRYNVVQWVQRSSRGWSYGGGIRDPRTGEMIKGHVVLGALRVRQDCMIFEALMGTSESGTSSPNDPVEASLARLRQLAAHEIGHTLGLAHNFAASTYGRASVMDYPAPLVELVPTGKGEALALTIEHAYGIGIGEWDKVSIRHLYADLGHDGPAQRESWLAEAYAQGMVYLTDGDSRSPGSADPRANLWDNGEDAVIALEQLMEVRRVGLANFDTSRLTSGESTALLEELLVPVFFLHRFQVEAAARFVGGRIYQHSLVGDGRAGVELIEAGDQRRALDALLLCLNQSLDVPAHIHSLLGPRTLVQGRRRELFSGRTNPILDELGLAEGAARLVIQFLLAPARLERVVQQSEWDSGQLTLDELLARLLQSCLFADSALSAPRKALVQHVLVDELLSVASNLSVSAHVRAMVEANLGKVVVSWEARSASQTDDEVAMARRIQRFLDRDSSWKSTRPRPSSLPPGSPIGCGGR